MENVTDSEIAFHEAGHAVAAYHRGFLLAGITVAETDDFLGRVKIEPDNNDGADYVVTMFAGGVAQQMHRQDADLGQCWADNDIAADILSANPALSESDLRKQTVDLITQHWREVEALASAVLAHSTLTGDECEFIILTAAEGLQWQPELASFRKLRSM